MAGDCASTGGRIGLLRTAVFDGVAGRSLDGRRRRVRAGAVCSVIPQFPDGWDRVLETAVVGRFPTFRLRRLSASSGAAGPNDVPCGCDCSGPRIAVVKGAAFARACASVIDAPPSRWAISHVIRASTATRTMTTSPITSISTGTIGICSYTDHEASCCLGAAMDGRSSWAAAGRTARSERRTPAAAFRALCAQVLRFTDPSHPPPRCDLQL
jgi:hypothetical protein